eukprot:scaffold1190_cov69-Cylindrotheca_fusiformis.AAC.12
MVEMKVSHSYSNSSVEAYLDVNEDDSLGRMIVIYALSRGHLPSNGKIRLRLISEECKNGLLFRV